jgi:nucleoside-diphosphate-sugar epimerase
VYALAPTDKAARAVERAGAEAVRGNLDDPESLRDGMRGTEVVFHAAAKVDDWGRPADFERVNVEGTKNVLWAMRYSGVPRVVHVSTAFVLADGRPLVGVDEAAPHPRRPAGWLNRTKLDAERAVLAAGEDGLEPLVVRLAFVWGPGDTVWLPRFVEAVRTGRFRWVGGGRHLLSTTHVANAAHGLMLAADRGRPGEIYFLTDGPPVVFRELVTRYLATAGVTPPHRSVPPGAARALAAASEAVWSLFGVKKPPPMTRTTLPILGRECTVSDAKARAELGYEPVIDLDAGMEELAEAKARRRSG